MMLSVLLRGGTLPPCLGHNCFHQVQKLPFGTHQMVKRDGRALRYAPSVFHKDRDAPLQKKKQGNIRKFWNCWPWAIRSKSIKIDECFLELKTFGNFLWSFLCGWGGCISQIHKTSVKIVTGSLFSNSVVKKLQKIQWYNLRPTFYQSNFCSPKRWAKKRLSLLVDFLFLGMKILSDRFLEILWNWIGQLLIRLGGIIEATRTKVCVVWRGVEISLSNQGGHFCDAQVRPHVEVHGIDNLDERNFEMFQIVGAWTTLDL